MLCLSIQVFPGHGAARHEQYERNAETTDGRATKRSLAPPVHEHIDCARIADARDE